jgi:hypothetical protein
LGRKRQVIGGNDILNVMDFMKIISTKREQILVNEKFNIRLYDLPKQLKLSIETEVINPLIVCKQECGFLLLDGFRRYFHSKSKDFSVTVFDNLKDAFLKSVELNMLTNPYTEIEKAKAVFVAVNYCQFSKEEVLTKLNRLLGLAKKMEVVNQYLEIFKIEQSLFNFLTAKKAPVALFSLFLRETEEDCKLLTDLFESNRLSVSQIRKIYDLMFYIRKREAVSFSDILKNIKDGELEKQLTKRRFPIFFNLKQELGTLLKNYKGFLSFPSDFEDTKLTFSAKLGTVNDINKAIEALEKLKKDKLFSEFMKKL